MSITDPRDISGLVLWYSAEAETGYSDNQDMTQWTDLSGNGNHATPGGSGNAPRWRTAGGPSSGPSIEFSASQKYFSIPNVLTGLTSGELFSWYKAGSGGVNVGGWKFGSSGNDCHWPFSNDLVYEDFGSTARKNNINVGSGASDITSWCRINSWSAASDWKLRINETDKATDTGNTVGWTTAPKIGHVNASTMRHTCLVIFDRKLNSTERADMITWMQANPGGGTLATTVAGSLASETDTALAGSVNAPVTVAGSLASETDTALAGSSTDYDWLVELRVGTHEWSITSACSLEDESPVHVLAGLRIGWQIDESKPWPTQPNPTQAAVGFITDDVANLDDVTIGTTMSVVLLNPGAQVLATFHGRVAQLTATPRKRGDDLFMLYQVAGVDYTVDLAETPIVLTAVAAQDADDRFDTIVDAAAAAGTAPITPPTEVGTAAFDALTASTTNAGTLLGSHLDQVAVDVGDGLQRNVVVPVVDTTTDELDRFDCLLLERTVDAALLPGTFEVVEGLLTITFPDMTADGVVDACTVQLDTVWNRLKFRAVNRVTVTSDTATVEATRPGPPVRLELTSTLTDLDALQVMADLYLPDVDETNGWVADPFTLLAYLDLAQILPTWFPDHRQDPAQTTVYVQPIAIVGVPAEINLAGDTVYAGQLSQAALTINQGLITVTFALRRQLPVGIGDDAASWEWAQAEFPTVAWEDIDPGLSWYEARLGRAT